ncbi:hypothetical protein AVEN_248172-1 [Araneus ventricosus]|uniref:Uncharacterized protein n=1 Tax=Araneus ventricosus TaxID=182803 RepID=A0A4Y2WCN5_ARAVE|nr:hypothetical protein AVEN_248172-1 [Araneus ventricosus]
MSKWRKARIEELRKSNHETWKLQMEAVLIKNDRFKYVSEVARTLESKEACDSWKIEDSKTKAYAFSQVSCSWSRKSSRDQSKGPARKANHLKSLLQLKMGTGRDVPDYVRKFFDTIDKLQDLDIVIDEGRLDQCDVGVQFAC